MTRDVWGRLAAVSVMGAFLGVTVAVGGCKGRSATGPRGLPASRAGGASGAASGAASRPRRVLPKGLSKATKRRFPWRYLGPKARKREEVGLFRGDGFSVAQVADGGGLFASAPTKARKLVSGTGLLVCEIRVTYGDFFTKADIVATMSFPGEGLVFFRGPADHPRVFFSLPRPRLKAGTIAIRLMDQDVTTRKDIARLEFPFAGTLPFVAKAPRGKQVACRWLNAAEVAARVKGAEATVATHMKAARKAVPKLSRPGYMGYEESAMVPAWRAVVRLAAFLGWDDARVKTSVAAFHGEATRWAKAAERIVARARVGRAVLPRKASVVVEGMRLVVKAVRCDRAALLAWSAKDHYRVTTAATLDTPCFVRLGLTAGKSSAMGVDNQPWKITTITGITSRGFDVDMAVVARVDSSGTSFRDKAVAPGGKGTLIAAPREDIAMGTHAGTPPANTKGKLALIRLCSEERGCLLRAE